MEIRYRQMGIGGEGEHTITDLSVFFKTLRGVVILHTPRAINSDTNLNNIAERCEIGDEKCV